jgi:hypothetical protein
LEREIAALTERHGQLTVFDEDDSGFLIAFTFTLAAHAAKPDNTLSYVTRPMVIAGIINTMMMHKNIGMQRYAPIIAHLVERTTLSGRLPKSVYDHLERAKTAEAGNLCLEEEPEWAILADLTPEVFDPPIREQMTYLGSLPVWVLPMNDRPVASEIPHARSQNGPVDAVQASDEPRATDQDGRPIPVSQAIVIAPR